MSTCCACRNRLLFNPMKQMATMLKTTVVSVNDNLTKVVDDINAALWDEANEISSYREQALRQYLSTPDTVFITCYSSESGEKKLLGMASGRVEIKPYDATQWLYVDEVDVCVHQRRKGAGRALMEAMCELAVERDCELVWLGTEPDNTAANALYQSLEPDEVENFTGYCFELD